MANKQDYENKAMTTPPAGGTERSGRPGEVPPEPGRPAPLPEPEAPDEEAVEEADDPVTGTPPVRLPDPLTEPSPAPIPAPPAPR